MTLMVVNRLAGLVLPATSKLLIDNVIGRHRADLLWPIAWAAGAATLGPGGVGLRPRPGPGHRGTAVHHRYAPDGRGTRRAPAGRVLRFDEDRRAHLAHHVGRRGHPESRGHRSRAAGRRDRDRRHRPWRALLAELETDDRHAAAARRVWRGDGAGLLAPAADLPRARQDQRRSHRASGRDAGRHPDREGLHRGKARSAGLHEGRAPAVPQRRADDARELGRRRGLHGDRRRHRHADDRDRRTRHSRRRDDPRRSLHVHLLHRARRRASRVDRVDWHADHRGLRRPRPHPRDPPDGDRGRRGSDARPHRARQRRGRVRQRDLRLRAGHAGLEGGVVPCAGRHDDGARRARADRGRALSSAW